MTRWTPDTCDDPPCVFEYTDDGTGTLTTTINKCTRHSSQADSTAYDNVKEENQRKNLSHQFIMDNGPAGLSDLVNGVKTLKNNITISWTWSGTPPDTILTLSYSGITLTQNQRNTVQSALNTRFGSGKVVLA